MGRLLKGFPHVSLRARGALVVLGVLLAAVTLGVPTLAAAPPAPDGALTLTGTAPNYHYLEASAPNHGGASIHQSIYTTAIPDPANHLLFEYDNNDSCIRLFGVDIDTYAVKTPRLGSPCPDTGNESTGLNIAYFAVAPLMAIDSKDQLIFAPWGATLTTLDFYNENTLQHLGSWSLPTMAPPATAQHYMVGVSWFPAEDSILVVTDNQGLGSRLNIAPGVPGVTVTSVSVPLSLKAGHPVVLWSRTVPLPCQYTVLPNYATASAYESRTGGSAFVPCIIQYAPGFQQKSAVGMFKLELKPAAQGGSCQSPQAASCPDGAYKVAEAPGPTADVFFDAASDRAFMPSQSTEMDLLVYDGGTGTFGGSVKFGGQADLNLNAVGLDTNTGRLYTMAPTTGLTLIDGRRTPVPAGSRYPQYHLSQQINAFAALPPDSVYPYTRLLVNDDQGLYQANTGVQPDFLVFADRVPLAVDPPVNSVDANTHSGPVPPGSAVQDVYGASARGFAFHHDYVGGLNGQSFDVDGQGLDSPGGGTNDLLGANVSALSIRNGLPLGSASALTDAAGQGGYLLGQCSKLDYDLSSLRSCVGRPDCAITQFVGGSCPDQPGIPTPEPTGTPLPPSQGWPFPQAVCPAGDGQPVDNESGANGTMPDGSTTRIPGSDIGAGATADCSLPVARGEATLESFGGGLPGYSIGVAGGDTTTSVALASGTKPLTSSATAVARGIDIATLSSAGVRTPLLHINSVTQSATVTAAGVPGSTSAANSLLLEGVFVNGSEICGVCDIGTATDQINTLLSARMKVELPAPDPRFLNNCKGARLGGTMTCGGTPGGYQASVEADLNEQEGDQRFNQMTEEESTYLPGMRIVLYGFSDGSPTRDREVLDLAGVAVDTEYGVSVLPPPSADDLGGVPIDLAAEAAGVPTSYTVPGTPGQPGSSSLVTTLQQVVRRLFEGFAWFTRHPLEALQMFALLSLLALPVVMVRRRWTWFERRMVNV